MKALRNLRNTPRICEFHKRKIRGKTGSKKSGKTRELILRLVVVVKISENKIDMENIIVLYLNMVVKAG